MLKNKCSFFKPHRVFIPAPNRSTGASGPLSVWASVQEKTVMPVFLKRKPDNFLGSGGNPREPFCLLLGLGPKEGGRAFNAPFSGIPHVMRGHTEKPFFFPLVPRGTPFLSAKKGGKEVPRGEPLGTPGGWPTFFSGKPAGGRIPEPAYIQERACGPGVWVAAIFHPRAQPVHGGPGPPCCMDFGSGKNGNAGFPKKKTGHFLGVWGQSPQRRFCILLSPGTKGCGRAFDIFFIASRSFCADIPKSRFSFRLCREAPPFFPQRKGGKKRQGALLPEPPGSLPAFFLGKPAGGWIPKPTHIQKRGCGPL